MSKVAILTDSQSGIMALQSSDHRNFLIDEFIDLIVFATRVEIHFIPGHAGIRHNEIVDQAARDVTNGGILRIRWPIKDAVARISDILWSEWSEEYNDLASRSSSHYFRLFPNPSKKTWFNSCEESPQDQKTINRILSNHCFCSSTLAKMHVTPEANCDVCDVEETASHILFQCGKYALTRARYPCLQNMDTVEEFVNVHGLDKVFELTRFLSEVDVQL
uniref:RNase H type-1 domain-containing protein n=1 Tax=Stomoxys calcitrans TaxID=35570 RepID=A0A1I8QER0_STOCA